MGIQIWRELIHRLSDEVKFSEPASGSAIGDIESQLGQPLPTSLRTLLLETNGVRGHLDLDVVWSAEKIASENKSFRIDPSCAQLYMSFDSLMFFGDNGGGDQFAFIRTLNREEDIFVWDHETDERILVAFSLEQYLSRCFDSATASADWYR